MSTGAAGRRADGRPVCRSPTLGDTRKPNSSRTSVLVLYSRCGMPRGNDRDPSTATHGSRAEPQKHTAEWEKGVNTL